MFDDCLSFQNPTTSHLTLHYWQEMTECEYHEIVQSVGLISSSTVSFDLRVISPDIFLSKGRASVLFLGIESSPELALLKKRCPWPDDLPFHPHITLAWISSADRFSMHKKEIMKLLQSAPFVMRADRIRLYSVIGGKKQTPLQDFSFAS